VSAFQQFFVISFHSCITLHYFIKGKYRHFKYFDTREY
jgi:hypothetical protein